MIIITPPPVRSYTTRVSTSPTRTTFSIRTRPSIFEREYKRIENKVRSRPGHLFTDSYLNSDSVRVSVNNKRSICILNPCLCVDWPNDLLATKIHIEHFFFASQAFDDATKTIRNDTNNLMRKIHQRVERAQSCLPASSYTAK